MATLSSNEAGDALDALRQALITAPPNEAEEKALGANIRLLTSDGAETSEVTSASIVEIAGHSFPAAEATRLARSRGNPALAPDALETPTTSPESFFSLAALLFALQMMSAQGGVYVVQATFKGLARFDAVERADILAYLTGKRATWEGVLSVQDVLAREQQSAASIGVDAQMAAAQDVGPSTTPPGSPPMSLRQLHGQSTAKLPIKRPYNPSRTDAAFVKRLRASGTEIVLQNRNDAMHGSHPWTKTADFSAFRAALAPTIEAARKAANAGGTQSGRNGAMSASQGQSGMPARKQRAQDPIIVLSNSPTALINMFNVKQLLEDGVFVDPMEARRAANGIAESIVVVNHRLSPTPAQQGGRTGRLLVVDNTDALARLGGSSGGTDVWSRVVAVFTTGQAWQFKTYPWTDPRELFKHVLGVYVRWHNEQKAQSVRDWPVTELVIDQATSKRHTDRQVVAHFWRNVEGFVARKKPHLL